MGMGTRPSSHATDQPTRRSQWHLESQNHIRCGMLCGKLLRPMVCRTNPREKSIHEVPRVPADPYHGQNHDPWKAQFRNDSMR